MINLLIEPLCVGFLVVVTLNVARYWLIRQTGYWFFLPVLMIGKLLLYVVDIGLDVLDQYLDSARGDWMYGLGSATLWATALAVLIPILANKGIGRERSARLAARLRGNLIEFLMQESIDSGRFVEITLETGKSYVGLVVDSGIATPNESDVSIVPIFSGYRDVKHELQLTTSYRKAILDALEDDDLDESALMSLRRSLELVLSKGRIVSARRFDIEIYTKRFGRSLP